MLRNSILLLLVAPFGVVQSFTLVAPSNPVRSTSRLHYEPEDNGGMDAYAKALEAAYGAANQDSSSTQEDKKDTTANDANANDEWVAQQVNEFIDQADETTTGGLPPQPVSDVTAEPTPTDAAPAREADIADDFIALKNDIERYVFSETEGTRLFPSDEEASAELAASEEPEIVASEEPEIVASEEPEVATVDEPALPEPTTTAAINSALEQFAQEIDTPWIEQTVQEEPCWFGDGESVLLSNKEATTIVDQGLAPSPQDQEQELTVDVKASLPTIEQGEEVSAVIAESSLPTVEQEEEPTVVAEESLPTIQQEEEEESIVAAIEQEEELTVAAELMPIIEQEEEKEEPIVTPEASLPTIDKEEPIITAESSLSTIDKEVKEEPTVVAESVTPIEQQEKTMPVKEDALEIPVVAEFSSIEEARQEMFAEEAVESESDVVPEPVVEEEKVEESIMMQDKDIVQEEAPVIEEATVEETLPDLSFALSDPESTLTVDMADDEDDTPIDEEALNDLVSAIEQFGESDDAETLVAALEANPISDSLNPVMEEAAKAQEDSATARIVDVSDTEEGQSLQATSRSPVQHDNAEPPAVFKFLGSLSKDLQEHTKKKIPEDLKPIADIAGKLWTNAFGKFTEAIAKGTHIDEQTETPSEVFYFNLNTQEGEWDPTSDDVSKSQMLSNEQGKSWTATIDSRGNFYVHYYDSEEDVPAPQLIATDSTWDQFSNGVGRVYYVNRETGDSQWEEPEDFGMEQKTVHSLNKHLEKKDLATEDSAMTGTPGYQQTNRHGKVGFNLPTFFDKIATKAKKAPVVDDESKTYFEPKPPSEDPWWKAEDEERDPTKLRP